MTESLIGKLHALNKSKKNCDINGYYNEAIGDAVSVVSKHFLESQDEMHTQLKSHLQYSEKKYEFDGTLDNEINDLITIIKTNILGEEK